MRERKEKKREVEKSKWLRKNVKCYLEDIIMDNISKSLISIFLWNFFSSKFSFLAKFSFTCKIPNNGKVTQERGNNRIWYKNLR